MISVVQNIATPEPNESSAPRVCPASEERSHSNSSASANNPATAINPASPAHDLRGQAVGERSQIIQGKSGPTFVLGFSNQEPLQRVYGSPEAREAAAKAILLGCSTQILFKPAS
jgi:hypothetical protein